MGLEVDDLEQVWTEEDEFLGLICEECGSLRASVNQKIKLEVWLNSNKPEYVDCCPFCECPGWD